MEFEYLLRVLLAGVCGALIGYERKSRLKEAGIRTHFVVAVGAALMIIISKYGFQDQAGWEGVGLDPSRVAAQVVSGVGFLGAGMIFMQKQTVKGLTTAAGVWTTAGIGMAAGAGMYEVGIGVTILVLAAQSLFHRKYKWLASPRTEMLNMRITNEPTAISVILQLLGEKGVSVQGYHVEQEGDNDSILNVELTVRFAGQFQLEELIPVIQQYSFIKSVDIST